MGVCRFVLFMHSVLINSLCRPKYLDGTSDERGHLCNELMSKCESLQNNCDFLKGLLQGNFSSETETKT